MNLGASHIPCSQVTRKRKHSIADIMKLDPNKANTTVLFNTLLSPDCDNAVVLKKEGQISFPIGLFPIICRMAFNHTCFLSLSLLNCHKSYHVIHEHKT